MTRSPAPSTQDREEEEQLLPVVAHREPGGESPPLLLARRDALGFLTETPSLSQEQVTYLIARMSAAGDQEAARAAHVNLHRVRAWQKDAGFARAAELCLSDKREAFRLLGAQLLPKTLETIAALYEKALKDGNLRAAQIALSMHLRSQGLLIDRVANDDTSKVDALLALLRETRPVQVLDMAPRP